jgi:DNA-directed RNA polymerase subunit RPC12/RpoP
LGMERAVQCRECGNWFKISGAWDDSAQVLHKVTCPNCAEPNEVSWPMNVEVKTTG